MQPVGLKQLGPDRFRQIRREKNLLGEDGGGDGAVDLGNAIDLTESLAVRGPIRLDACGWIRPLRRRRGGLRVGIFLAVSDARFAGRISSRVAALYLGFAATLIRDARSEGLALRTILGVDGAWAVGASPYYRGVSREAALIIGSQAVSPQCGAGAALDDGL